MNALAIWIKCIRHVIALILEHLLDLFWIEKALFYKWLNISSIINLLDHFLDGLRIILLNLYNIEPLETNVLAVLSLRNWQYLLVLERHLCHLRLGDADH